jgi:hypothetical protein
MAAQLRPAGCAAATLALSPTLRANPGFDNANFFLVRDPAEPTDEQLYELLMTEYPVWSQAARSKTILS